MAAPAAKRKGDDERLPCRPKKRRGPYRRLESEKENVIQLVSRSQDVTSYEDTCTDDIVLVECASAGQNLQTTLQTVDENSDAENDGWIDETCFSDSTEDDSDDDLSAELTDDETDHVTAKQSKIPLFQIPSSNTPDTSTITKDEHLASVIAYAQRHCATYQAFSDLLKLIELHLPQDNECETSVFKVKAKYVNIGNQINCLKPEHGGTEM